MPKAALEMFIPEPKGKQSNSEGGMLHKFTSSLKNLKPKFHRMSAYNFMARRQDEICKTVQFIIDGPNDKSL